MKAVFLTNQAVIYGMVDDLSLNGIRIECARIIRKPVKYLSGYALEGPGDEEEVAGVIPSMLVAHVDAAYQCASLAIQQWEAA